MLSEDILLRVWNRITAANPELFVLSLASITGGSASGSPLRILDPRSLKAGSRAGDQIFALAGTYYFCTVLAGYFQ